MKNLGLLLVLFLLGVNLKISAQDIGDGNSSIDIFSSVPTEFWGAVSYNINDPEVVVDAYIDLGPYERIEVQNGIVSSCVVNGNHLYLTISREIFMDHIYRRYKDQGFWDLQVNIMYNTDPAWPNNPKNLSPKALPFLTRIVIIRIVFE